MDMDFEIDSEDIPEVDEPYHLFGDNTEHLFAETQEGGERDLYVIDFESQQVSQLDYSERSWFRTGATVWRLEDNEYGIEALVTPSAEDARRGDRPEIHYTDPVEDSELNEMLDGDITLQDTDDPLGAWFSAREKVGETGTEYGQTYVSKGKEV